MVPKQLAFMALLVLVSAGCSLLLSESSGEIGPDAAELDAVANVCGDGVLVMTEQCDDGNTAPSDGCDDSCMIEDGFGCPEGEGAACRELVGVTWSEAMPVPPTIGDRPAAGQAFEGVCSAPQVARSLAGVGTICDVSEDISQLASGCAEVEIANGVVTSGNALTLTTGAGTCDVLINGTGCPADQFVVGVRAATNSADRPTVVQIVCGSINHEGGMFVVSDLLPQGAVGHPVATTVQILCPSGSVAVGFEGRADLVVEELRLLCAPLEPVFLPN